ncbi:phage major tail protein, TP901-1 family [Bacillus haynesii]|uniref:phage major tail protein, TP901-1 family n=1 Tax=Bacillus TaxID=1386 RepID=UPI001C2243FC|nr:MULTISPECIES: phage major tail protein, TP901-1 family [Bacillus]MBU8759264.1 phage major tail protein, TP901-1 family [Bacillus paralicheniformis]MCY8347594.1 phage major tail protein, TP901-1 family [Bacillus haynesii]MCY8754833.1 phage major tail protein, TP901-1 family [Bacillus haynesii]MEC0709210.1 phage major tail protein, TP901-1 family [Bacillus haynesii]MEC0739172.1 phage major tail protein, TP901-1 family [Bacillus haynesii]
MGIEYRGEEFIYAVVTKSGLLRPFNQTDGSTSISADTIDLDTKDKTGSDYGKVTQELSIEGVITEGDVFVSEIKEAIWKKQFVEIYEINTRTKEAEKGNYMISSFEKTYSNGDFATYSLGANLNGSLTKETLTEVPSGAPDTENPTPTTP